MTFYDKADFNGTELRAFAGNFLYSTGANEVAGPPHARATSTCRCAAAPSRSTAWRWCATGRWCERRPARRRRTAGAPALGRRAPGGAPVVCCCTAWAAGAAGWATHSGAALCRRGGCRAAGRGPAGLRRSAGRSSPATLAGMARRGRAR
ncbi:MAG: hypothetical protein MZW92_54940 [Comamonadaceae bacterium]|nr:hypothetical protein [Comamonadaceae bacterium]